MPCVCIVCFVLGRDCVEMFFLPLFVVPLFFQHQWCINWTIQKASGAMTSNCRSSRLGTNYSSFLCLSYVLFFHSSLSFLSWLILWEEMNSLEMAVKSTMLILEAAYNGSKESWMHGQHRYDVYPLWTVWHCAQIYFSQSSISVLRTTCLYFVAMSQCPVCLSY